MKKFDYIGWVTKNKYSLLNEFKQPKSFDPDTLALVREMLEVADIHHDELVDDADTDEISSYLDKRTGGTIIKFPHFNGPSNPALFGKETTDQIDRSKAKANAAALKVYTQFKTYIEDYEISDVSQAGVGGNIYLWVMFNDLAKDYTAPKGGTQSSQFEEIEDNVMMNLNPDGEVEIRLEDLTFDQIVNTFTDDYQNVQFTRKQSDGTEGNYYRDSISFPNFDDSLTSIGDENAWEDWKSKTMRHYGNITLVLKPGAKNWFDKVFIDDEEFNTARDEFIRGKMSAMQRDDERGWSTD